MLELCGIAYTASEVLGWGYGSAPVQPVIWRAGQSGERIVGELDRVFGCATIELGNGRRRALPVSRAPLQYSSPTYAKTFVRGRAARQFLRQ